MAETIDLKSTLKSLYDLSILSICHFKLLICQSIVIICDGKANEPLGGYLSNLTIEQTRALAQMWVRLEALFSKPSTTEVHLSNLEQLIADSSGDIENQRNLDAENATSSPTASMCMNFDTSNPVLSVTIQHIREELWLANQDVQPDTFILRFLRARKFNVPKAFAMLISALKWRIMSQVQHLIQYGESIVDQSQLECGKAFLYKFDRQNRPVMYINVEKHERGNLPLDHLQRHTVYLMETVRLALPKSVENVAIVFNMTGFGLKNMDNEMVKFLISCLENYYPESLGVCLILNAPWIFQGVWKIISPWLDPVVQAKIHFVKPSELKKWIDPSCIPTFIDGGNDPYSWVYVPPTSDQIELHRKKLQDNDQRSALMQARLLAGEKYERATTLWSKAWLSHYGSVSVSSTGATQDTIPSCQLLSLDELKRAREEVFQNDLTSTWWKLDAFLRFPTVWHRLGVFSEGHPGANWDSVGLNGILNSP
jgi:hypothetical protein